MRFILRDSSTISPSSIFISSLPTFGSVGQIAIDGLIANLSISDKLYKLGIIECDNVIPMTGYEEFCRQWGRSLCMPIEVYAIKNTSYVLIQQRSQVLPNKALEFANEFLELFKSVNFSRLIIVSGVSAECITDDFMLTSDRFFRTNCSLENNISMNLLSLHPQQLKISSEYREGDANDVFVDLYPVLSAFIDTVGDKYQNVEIIGRFCTPGDVNLLDGQRLSIFVDQLYLENITFSNGIKINNPNNSAVNGYPNSKIILPHVPSSWLAVYGDRNSDVIDSLF